MPMEPDKGDCRFYAGKDMRGAFRDKGYLHVEQLSIHALKQGGEVFLVKALLHGKENGHHGEALAVGNRDHPPFTSRQAGHILVFNEKRFITNRSHDALHEGNGYFQSLFSQQFRVKK
jgi:hypothetical protein